MTTFSTVHNDLEVSPTVIATKELIRSIYDTYAAKTTLLFSGQDAVLIDVALSVAPNLEVVFIDTGFHFPETLDTVVAVARRYRCQLRVVAPRHHRSGVGAEGFCCGESKVDQLDAALAGKEAWFSGLRRADSEDRAATELTENDRRGLVKVNPLAYWSDELVDAYIEANNVIVNPLRHRGYASIGCAPCTQPTPPGADPRSGRWMGLERTECGIHR